MNKILTIVIKTSAIFVISAISAIGVGSLVGVDPWKTALIAGTIGVLRVIENVARGLVDDGKVTLGEIDTAFTNAANNIQDTTE